MGIYNVFLVLIILAAVLLILIIMVQNPKGGGLSSSFGGAGESGSSMGSVQGVNDFLSKGTWFLVSAMIFLILASNFAIPRAGSKESQVESTLKDRELPQETLPEVPQNTQEKSSEDKQDNKDSLQ